MKAHAKQKIASAVPKKKCKYCLSTENLTYDHKFPIVLGGKNDPINIQVLCMRCNGIKSSMPHKVLLGIARWVHLVNKERLKHGKSPLGFHKGHPHYDSVPVDN